MVLKTCWRAYVMIGAGPLMLAITSWPPAIAAAADPLPFRAYATTTTLMCAAKQVIVTTSCFDSGFKDEARPYCYRQDVTFPSRRDRVKTATYKYTYDDESSHLFVQVGCLAAEKGRKRGDMIVLSGTNFGNCIGCEWEDVYTADGIYIGSTSESDEYPQRDRNGRLASRITGSTIRHGHLPSEVNRALSNGSWRAEANIGYVAPPEAQSSGP